MSEEILNKYIELIDKDYCDDCNELNCLGNSPCKEIAKNIKLILEENRKYKEVINKAINYIDEYRDYQDVHKQVGIDKYEDVREDILFEENIEELLDILKEVEHD